MHDHLLFTLWDVEHGLATWIRTPSGHNHWIDAGYNSSTDFSPAERVKEYYKESTLHFLVISHPDADHINGLPEVTASLGNPRVFCRNRSLPPIENHAFGQADYQKEYRLLDLSFTSPVPDEFNPYNSQVTGGVEVWTEYLPYEKAGSSNDSSVVCFYSYAGWLFVCPGDIGPSGWKRFFDINRLTITALVGRSHTRVLVAPHHGRPSGFSADMMNALKPSLVLISDKRGLSPTEPKYYSQPSGVTVDGNLIRYLSTKSVGRIQFKVPPTGTWFIDYWKTS